MLQPSITSLTTALVALVYSRVSLANLVDEFFKEVPAYCADKDIFSSTRAIPALPAPGDTLGATDPLLTQVQMMTRHGTTVPSGFQTCWGKKSTSENNEMENRIYAHASDIPTFHFRKLFDVRPSGNWSISNPPAEATELSESGHLQMREIGKILADKYFNDKTETTKNLFDLHNRLTENLPLGDIHFRSIDTPAALSSGMQLLTNMVKEVLSTSTDPKILLSTVSRETDSLRPNPNVCLDLQDAMRQAYSSKEYSDKFGTKNKPARELAEGLMKIKAHPDFGAGAWPWHALECLTVAICTGLNLPSDKLWTKANVDLVLNSAIEEHEWLFHANNSLYSKLASATFAFEFKASIAKHLCKGKKNDKPLWTTCVASLFESSEESDALVKYIDEDKTASIPDHKFIYFSAADAIILAFLASFGMDFVNKLKIAHTAGPTSTVIGLENAFPGYATLLVFELYTAAEVPYFRLIYNGRVITEHVPGCLPDKHLCLVTSLFKTMNWATADLAKTSCKITKPKVEPQKSCPVCPTSPPEAKTSDPTAVSLSPLAIAAAAALAGYYFA